VISHAMIRIQLQEVADGSDGARILTFLWTRPSPYRKREILQGMPARCPLTRAILIEAFAMRIAGWTNFSPIPA
jgi:hypothetical protein